MVRPRFLAQGNLNPGESLAYPIHKGWFPPNRFFHGAGQDAAFLQDNRLAGGLRPDLPFCLWVFNRSVKSGPRTV